MRGFKSLSLGATVCLSAGFVLGGAPTAQAAVEVPEIVFGTCTGPNRSAVPLTTVPQGWSPWFQVTYLNDCTGENEGSVVLDPGIFSTVANPSEALKSSTYRNIYVGAADDPNPVSLATLQSSPGSAYYFARGGPPGPG